MQLLIRSQERSDDLASSHQVYSCEQAGQGDGLCFLLSLEHAQVHFT